MIEQVGRFAGECLARPVPLGADPLGLGVVPGGEEDLGRFLGDLAADRVDASSEQPGGV